MLDVIFRRPQKDYAFFNLPEVTERERATFSGVEASVDECSPTFCKLNILPPHPLFGHKVLLERKNFFVKGLPMLYSARFESDSRTAKLLCFFVLITI